MNPSDMVIAALTGQCMHCEAGFIRGPIRPTSFYTNGTISAWTKTRYICRYCGGTGRSR